MIATVNGTPISDSDVEREIKNILAQYQQNFPPEQVESLKKNVRQQAIETLINRILLFSEADRQHIEISADQVAVEISHLIDQFPSAEIFETKIEAAGLSRERIEKDIARQLKIDMLIRQSMTALDIHITDEERELYYQKNSDHFSAPEQVQASHILFMTTPETPDSERTRKRLELAGLQGQIEKGADFSEMAKKHSDCPSKEKGGDLGFFERGKMVKPFEEVAFTLNPGEVSDIVETQFGYHLIKVLARKASKTSSFEEVKEHISNHLTAQKEQEAFFTYVRELRKAANIEYGDGSAPPS
jgi:peptidyl-prolyl cis-trans isomerase C